MLTERTAIRLLFTVQAAHYDLISHLIQSLNDLPPEKLDPIIESHKRLSALMENIHDGLRADIG